jgi:hypothetical protein
MDGPIERINGPFTKQKSIYYKDGENYKYVLFMTKGVIDSIYRFDSLTHGVNGVKYPSKPAEKAIQDTEK